MNRNSKIWIILLAAGWSACGGNDGLPEATGTFEAEEVLVSAEVPGRLIRWDLQEGDLLAKDSAVGQVDPLPLSLQKEQVEATLESLQEKTLNSASQVQLLRDQLAVQQVQQSNLLREKVRTENLLKADAATTKQLDDLNAQLEVLDKQMQVTRQQIRVQQDQINTQNRSILSEGKPLSKRAAQLEDQLQRSVIRNPVAGTVIQKFARAGEWVGAGKALYKIGDLTSLTLRAYVSASQLSLLKLGQTIKVKVDEGESSYRSYSGQLYWISDHAEFTPKTIQTKEERTNLVYAIKVRVKNDGFLKIGMYGEINW
ncbi:MAG: HlyD family secretion protein [Chitinophagaceae bacterium]